jgi:hypothetical protein
LALDALSGRAMTQEEVGQLVSALFVKAPGATEWYAKATALIVEKKASPAQTWPHELLAKCAMERLRLSPEQIVQVTLSVYVRDNKFMNALVAAASTPAAMLASMRSMEARVKATKAAKKKKKKQQMKTE